MRKAGLFADRTVPARAEDWSTLMTTRTLPVETENQWFQLVQTLKNNRQKRRHEGLFFVEGVRSINQLRGNPRWQAEALLYAEGRRLSGWAHDVLTEVASSYHLVVKKDLMNKLSDREESSEIIAVVKIPATRAWRICRLTRHRDSSSSTGPAIRAIWAASSGPAMPLA